MRRRITRIAQLVLLAACFLGCVLCHARTSSAVSDGLWVCARMLVPSLFPFFVCTNLFFGLGFSDAAAARLGPIAARLLGLPHEAGPVFVAGLLGGFPSGAQSAATLYRQGRLTREEAAHASVVCNNAGPAFLIGVMGGSIFHSLHAGLVLYAIHVLSALAAAALFRQKAAASRPVFRPKRTTLSFAEAFTQAVRSAGMSCVTICMYVTVFSVLASFFELLCADHVPARIYAALRGFLELSSGAAALQGSPIPPASAFRLVSAQTAFGGLCVHAQSRALLSDAGLRPRGYLPKKLAQAALAWLIAEAALLLIPHQWLFPADAAVFLGSTELPQRVTLLICAVFCLIFRKLWAGNLDTKRV